MSSQRKHLQTGLAVLLAFGTLSHAGESLRILTYNDRTSGADAEDAATHNDWAHRRPLALKLLKDVEPDIVGIQEATDGQIRDLAIGFVVLRKEELALLYRADHLEALEGGSFKLGAFGNPDPWGDRWALWQRFRKRSGGTIFTIYVTHLSTAKDQLPQAKAVVNAAAKEGAQGQPVLVMGDFNFDASKLLIEGGFLDALKADTKGTFHAFKGGRDGERIDFIATRGLKPLEAGVYTASEPKGTHTIFPSDHYPVWATFEWPR